jgi:hypothetical protein
MYLDEMQGASAWMQRMAIRDASHKSIQDKHKIMQDIGT